MRTLRTPPSAALTRRWAVLPAALLVVALATAPALAAGSADQQVPGTGVTVAAGAPALPTDVTGTSWVVADLDTGAVLAARDAHRRLLPASTLKALTALALIPRIERTSTIVPTFQDVNVEGSRVGLVEGIRYPAYHLFRGLLMTSGNDAANALATAAGGPAATAQAMNEEAARVGAVDTHAVNPSGLDAPGQLTTAYDLALIARAAMQLPDFRTYVGTKRSTILGRMGKPLRITSHDKLLFNYDGAIGIKNGYTAQAGATFVGAATRDGHTLLVTVLHATPRVWPEVAHLLDWGFAATAAGAAPVGQLVDPVRAEVTTSPGRGSLAVSPRATVTQGPGTVPLGVVALTAGGTALVVRRRRRPLR